VPVTLPDAHIIKTKFLPSESSQPSLVYMRIEGERQEEKNQ
jgi:hypothetical protein